MFILLQNGNAWLFNVSEDFYTVVLTFLIKLYTKYCYYDEKYLYKI